MIGERISIVLNEIEESLWEFEAVNNIPPKYTTKGFRASIKIVMSALLDKMWEMQEAEKMPIDDRVNMAQKAGEDMRKLIKTYTNIDSHSLYK